MKSTAAACAAPTHYQATQQMVRADGPSSAQHAATDTRCISRTTCQHLSSVAALARFQAVPANQSCWGRLPLCATSDKVTHSTVSVLCELMSANNSLKSWCTVWHVSHLLQRSIKEAVSSKKLQAVRSQAAVLCHPGKLQEVAEKQ